MQRFVMKKSEPDILSVSLGQDGTDVDIVVTNAKGESNVIAYLDEDGLTLCTVDSEIGIETNDGGYIQHQEG